MLACVLSLLFSPDRADSFRVLLYYVTGFLLCWVVAASCRDLAGLRRLLGFLYLSLLLVSAEAIVQRLMGLVAVNASFTDTAINVGVPGRVYGSLDNPNNLSGFLQTILPLGAAFAGGTKREGKRFLLTLGLVLPVVALVMTYSRSGWLAMLLAALVYLFYYGPHVAVGGVRLIRPHGVLFVEFMPGLHARHGVEGGHAQAGVDVGGRRPVQGRHAGQGVGQGRFHRRQVHDPGLDAEFLRHLQPVGHVLLVIPLGFAGQADAHRVFAGQLAQDARQGAVLAAAVAVDDARRPGLRQLPPDEFHPGGRFLFVIPHDFRLLGQSFQKPAGNAGSADDSSISPSRAPGTPFTSFPPV